jgi:crotonobetaine/carnitine-CoA ligase
MPTEASTLPPSRLSDDETLVLPSLLRERAASHPDEVFLQHVDDSTMTFGELERRVRCWMHELAEAGVEAGDRVVTLLPPSFDAVAVWMAAARLQAIETPANTAYKGEFLAHVIRDAAPRCVVSAARFAGQLGDIAAEVDLPPVLVHDGEAALPGDAALPAARLDLRPAALGTEHEDADYSPRPHDVATIVYTSGTSGRSKGVVVHWAQEYATARWIMPVEGRAGDVWYGPWAMFHVSGKVGLYNSAILGGRLVIRDGFSTSNFWPDVRRFGVTSTMLVASTVAFLIGQSPAESDRHHSLRNVVASPLPDDVESFAERFGVRLCTLFNMTETASPLTTGWDELRPGTCGRPRPGVEARVVDEHGDDVMLGEVGELVLRMRAPHEIMGGYWQAPEATVEAWRDLWFHTGDAVRADGDGYFYFVDRLKDTIRRGGENISSTELEAAVNSHPLVRESAAVGVPTPWGDRDVKLFVVPAPGFDAADLAHFLEERLPRYMMPSYISVIDALPKTHTARVKKAELRGLPNDQPTWKRQRTRA